MSPNDTSSITTDQTISGKVSVFISYARNDSIIAQTLYEELTDINPDRVECFLDTKTIQSGRNFEVELDNALECADWLICIYTGEQSEYCGYEIGVFKRSHGISPGMIDSRLVCLHDVEELPGVFRNHQNRLVTFPPDAKSFPESDETEFYQRSQVAAFLSNFYEYKGLSIARNTEAAQRQIAKLIRQSKRITEAFKAARRTDILADTPTQLRVEVSIPGSSEEALQIVPDNAEITGTFQSLEILGLMPHMVSRQLPVTKWVKLKQVLSDENGQIPLWLETVEHDMINAANGLVLSKFEVSFSSKDKIWRPILSRHVLYEGGGHKFEILFVETMPRQFLGAKITSALLAAIVMASRFRFAYFEENELSIIARIGTSYNANNIKCRQLLYDIERLDLEAMEFGLDPEVFKKAFGEDKRALAESFIENWQLAKGELLSTIRPAHGTAIEHNQEAATQAVSKFLQTVEAENRRFLLTAIDLYRIEMRKRLKATDPSVDS